MSIESIIALIPIIISTASAIAAITPTPQDDSLLAKLYKLLDVIALNVGKAKQQNNG